MTSDFQRDARASAAFVNTSTVTIGRQESAFPLTGAASKYARAVEVADGNHFPLRLKREPSAVCGASWLPARITTALARNAALMAAPFYSRIESAKLAGVDPNTYLRAAPMAALRGEPLLLLHELA